MKNAIVTDRGGLSPRPGTTLLGTNNTSSKKIRGFFNYRRSFNSNEILVKNYDDEMEAYSKSHTGADWFRVKNGFTADKEFGYMVRFPMPLAMLAGGCKEYLDKRKVIKPDKKDK